AVCYPDRFRAAEVRLELIKLQAEYLIDLEDAVVATKNSKGKVKLDQPVNLTATGAAQGGLWGTLIGLLFMNPLLGAGVGAAAGAVRGALTDVGISDDMMKIIANELSEDASALFVLARSATPDRVLERIQSYGGTVVESNLSHQDHDRLQRALDEARDGD
ncbi:MAG: DUF1269 domain-containing protein, partial [Myxococcota bacterium]